MKIANDQKIVIWKLGCKNFDNKTLCWKSKILIYAGATGNLKGDFVSHILPEL